MCLSFLRPSLRHCSGQEADYTNTEANDRRANIYFNILSPAPGTFLIALHFKGRDKPILEMDLKIDDLLEKVRYPLSLSWTEARHCNIIC